MDGEPCRPGVAITDLMAGLFIVDAVVAALYERNATGVGKNISTSLFQTQVSSSNFFYRMYLFEVFIKYLINVGRTK